MIMHIFEVWRGCVYFTDTETITPLSQYKWTMGLYSLSSKTSYRQISWSPYAARLDVIRIVSLWNLTGISAARLPNCHCAAQHSTNVSIFHGACCILYDMCLNPPHSGKLHVTFVTAHITYRCLHIIYHMSLKGSGSNADSEISVTVFYEEHHIGIHVSKKTLVSSMTQRDLQCQCVKSINFELPCFTDSIVLIILYYIAFLSSNSEKSNLSGLWHIDLVTLTYELCDTFTTWHVHVNPDCKDSLIDNDYTDIY